MRTLATLLDRIPGPARGAIATAAVTAGIETTDSVAVAAALLLVWAIGGCWDVWRSASDGDRNGIPDPIDRAVARMGLDPREVVEVVTEAARIGLPHALAWLRRIGRAGLVLALLAPLVACGGAQVVCPMGAEVSDVTARILADDGSGASAHVEAHFLVCGLPLVVTTDATSMPPAVEACVTAPLVGTVCEGVP